MFNITFSATKTDHGIKDPPLTEDGQRQAEELAGRVANLPVKRIICSPYREPANRACYFRTFEPPNKCERERPRTQRLRL